MSHTVYSHITVMQIELSRIKTLVSLNCQRFLYYEGKI